MLWLNLSFVAHLLRNRPDCGCFESGLIFFALKNWYMIGTLTKIFEGRKIAVSKKLVHKLVHKRDAKTRKARKIKVYKKGKIENETRNCRTSERRKKYII